jgi:hypothetical protein
MGTVIRILIFFICAFFAWGLWLAEVIWEKGWAGGAWLSGFNWSVLPICALTVATGSYFVDKGAEFSRRIKFIGAAWSFIIVAFIFVRWMCIAHFRQIYHVEMGPMRMPNFVELFISLIVILLVGVIGLSVSLVIIANQWLSPMRRWSWFIISIGLLLVLPLSYSTILVFPAISGDTDTIHSIKMGYPVFWTTVLVPVAMRLGHKRRIAKE